MASRSQKLCGFCQPSHFFLGGEGGGAHVSFPAGAHILAAPLGGSVLLSKARAERTLPGDTCRNRRSSCRDRTSSHRDDSDGLGIKNPSRGRSWLRCNFPGSLAKTVESRKSLATSLLYSHLCIPSGLGLGFELRAVTTLYPAHVLGQ